MRFFLCTCFLIAGFLPAAFSQTGEVHGQLQDNSDSTIVAGATVTILLQADSSVVQTALSDSSGSFRFTGLSADSFIVSISNIGYQEYVTFITLSDTTKDLGKITLRKQGKDLAVVTVVSKAPPVIQKGDTSQFSASQFKVNPDATTEDLIKKMPGITVDKDGTVTAQGEQVRKVTIDGRDFFGDDASAALKNLPSEVVDKIQVFDRLSDQAQLTGFDDGNSVKAINVVTKTGVKNGQFGRVYAGYGTDERYNAGGNISFFKGDRRLSLVGNFNNINQQNFGSQDLLGVTSSGSNNRSGSGGGGTRGSGNAGGSGNNSGGWRGGGQENFAVAQANGISRTNAFGINYGDKWGSKATITGSYFFNNSNNVNAYTTTTQTLGDIQQFSVQTGNTSTKNFNHRINLRLEYKPDSFNTIFIIPSINLQNNNSRSLATIRTRDEDLDSVNSSRSDIVNERKGYNIRNNIMYRHSFRKRGRSFSVGFNTAFTKNDGDAVTEAFYRFYDQDGFFSNDSIQQQQSENPSKSETYGGNLTYTEPLGKKSQLQFEYNPSVQKSEADQQTYLFDGSKYSLFDPRLSNTFDNRITANNGGLSYRLSASRDDMLSLGVNYQNTRLESRRTFPGVSVVDQSFSNFLPNAMWRRKISASSNVRLFYRASTNFPSVTQLQDVVNLTNPLRVSVGNPALKQSYTHFLGGRYTYTNSRTSRSFFANLFMQTTADYISNGIWIIRNDSTIQQGNLLNKGSQLTKPVNVDGYRNFRSFFTYSMPLKKLKTTVNLNAGLGYTRLPAMSNNRLTITDNTTYNGGVVFASNISEFIDFNLFYNLNVNNAHTRGQALSDNNFVNHIMGGTLNLLNKKGWFIQNDVTSQVYDGLSGSLDQRFTLWNAAVGKKFLKSKVAELKLSVFDILKQNQSVTRWVTESYIQDNQSTVLQRYFMVTFTYNLKNFGKPARSSTGQTSEGGMPPMRMGGPPM